jgi:hypothetical protein
MTEHHSVDIAMALLWWLVAVASAKVTLRLWIKSKERLDAILNLGLVVISVALAVTYTEHIDAEWLTWVPIIYVIPLTVRAGYTERRSRRKFIQLMSESAPTPGTCWECYTEGQLRIEFRPAPTPKGYADYWPYLKCGACGAEEKGRLDNGEDGVSHE